MSATSPGAGTTGINASADAVAERLLADALRTLPPKLGAHWTFTHVLGSISAYLAGAASIELGRDRRRAELASLVVAQANVCDVAHLVVHHEHGKPLGQASDLARRAYVRARVPPPVVLPLA